MRPNFFCNLTHHKMNRVSSYLNPEPEGIANALSLSHSTSSLILEDSCIRSAIIAGCVVKPSRLKRDALPDVEGGCWCRRRMQMSSFTTFASSAVTLLPVSTKTTLRLWLVSLLFNAATTDSRWSELSRAMKRPSNAKWYWTRWAIVAYVRSLSYKH